MYHPVLKHGYFNIFDSVHWCHRSLTGAAALPLSQALSLKEAEKALLSDRVSLLQAELSAAALEVKRLLREAADHKEQEEVPSCVVTIAPFTH